MSRLPYAAQQLLSQVAAHRPDAEVTQGEPDGFRVVRTISFDKATSKWLWGHLKNHPDERISTSEYSRGVLTLTFSSRSVLADNKQPFDLPAAPAVKPSLEPETSQGAEVQPEEAAS